MDRVPSWPQRWRHTLQVQAMQLCRDSSERRKERLLHLSVSLGSLVEVENKVGVVEGSGGFGITEDSRTGRLVRHGE